MFAVCCFRNISDTWLTVVTARNAPYGLWQQRGKEKHDADRQKLYFWTWRSLIYCILYHFNSAKMILKMSTFHIKDSTAQFFGHWSSLFEPTGLKHIDWWKLSTLFFPGFAAFVYLTVHMSHCQLIQNVLWQFPDSILKNVAKRPTTQSVCSAAKQSTTKIKINSLQVMTDLWTATINLSDYHTTW